MSFLRSREFLVGAGVGAGLVGAAWASSWAATNFEWLACKLFLRVDIGKMLVGDTREEQLLAHVYATATKGAPASVLAAMDGFCASSGFMMHVGPEKAELLRSTLRTADGEHRLQRVLDIGSYCGYSAIVLATALQTGSSAAPTIVSVEYNPTLAAIARAIVDYAGLSSQVTVIVSSAADAIRSLAEKHGRGSFDVVLMDHWERLYVQDAKNLEESGLLRSPGGLLLADNVVSHGAGKLLIDHLKGAAAKWDLELVACHLQYSKTEDALAIARAR